MVPSDILCNEKILQRQTMQREICTEIPGNFEAKQRKVKHDNSSKVFPRKLRKSHQSSTKTTYAASFPRSENAMPAIPRPCSATRRNNPHPSKNFLNWRVPTRTFGESKHHNVAEEKFLKSSIEDTFQRFYNDYSGQRKKLEEIETSVLLDLAKEYSVVKKKEIRPQHPLTATTHHPVPYLSSGMEAATSFAPLPGILQKQRLKAEKEAKKATCEGRVPMFIRPELSPVFKSWYDSISDYEQESIKQMLGTAEHEYLKETLKKTVRSEAVDILENWLMSADEKERLVAISFLEMLIQATSGKSPVPPPTASLPYQYATTSKRDDEKKKRKISSREKRKIQQIVDTLNRPRELRSPAILDIFYPCEASNTSTCQEQIPIRRHYRTSKTHKTKTALNKGALFVQPHRVIPQHFTIHPEWH